MKNTQIDPSDITNLSNKQLYKLCQKWGEDARMWMKKFASLLPEVEKRKLYRECGFHSIYEFAAKLAGMSNANVNDVLRTHSKVEDKPSLKKLIATEGWSKVRVVANIATIENEKEIAKRVKEMSKSSLETFAREIRNQESCPGTRFPQKNAEKSQVEFEKLEQMSFKVSPQTALKLRIFKQKLEKEKKEPATWNDVMSAFLNLAEKHENAEVSQIEKQTKKNSLKEIQKFLPKKSSRHIPAKVRNYLKQKHKGGCAYPNCNRPSEILHHTKRYILHQNHDPRFIKPLCKNHERLAHHTLIANETDDSKKWKIRLKPEIDTDRYRIDQRVQKHRQAALL